jgi:hypothetical protein
VDLKEMIVTQLREMEKRIEQYAGTEVRDKVMKGYQGGADNPDPVQGALGYKDAIDRLDKLADKPTIEKIMTACGCFCQSNFDQAVYKAKELRQQYATEEEFLDNFQAFDNGTRIERQGKNLLQHFSPGKIFPDIPGLRCACMLINGLPKGVYASPTVCECSRAFTEQRWEMILGRPVKVEIVSTPLIDDTDECQCIIYL